MKPFGRLWNPLVNFLIWGSGNNTRIEYIVYYTLLMYYLLS